MNNTCVGPCVHDVGSKRSGINSSELDACVTKVLDKLQPIRNSTNGNTRMGFYQGGTPTSAFRDFHSSRVTEKIRPRIEYWKYSAQRNASRNSIR